MTYPLSGTGVWSAALRYGEPSAIVDAAAELETLGFTAVWIPDVGGEVFAAVRNLLAATDAVTVATGILNLWMHEPEETAGQYATLTGDFGNRFLVGIGVSHSVLIDKEREGTYRHPLARTRAYLDRLDAVPNSVPVDARVLAALGPKMLELARTRAGGAHPYLVTPEHTAMAREALGSGRLLAPEQAVVLETDPGVARTIARAHLANYLGLPNYVNNWRRLGFTDVDIADGGSNRLVDALVAWGDEAAIAGRVQQHRDAGADHVCVQVLTGDPLDRTRVVMEQWRQLAPVIA